MFIRALYSTFCVVEPPEPEPETPEPETETPQPEPETPKPETVPETPVECTAAVQWCKGICPMGNPKKGFITYTFQLVS